MTKAFISYHHKNDQDYKEHLVDLAENYDAFENCSVDTGDIDEELSSERIRTLIRDDYLRDSKVTILLCGSETKFRKHIDWELKSSMINGQVNKKSGILVIDLPSSANSNIIAALPGEKDKIYPKRAGWYNIETKAGYKEVCSDLPERIIDNLILPDVKISMVQWCDIKNSPDNLKWLVNATAATATSNEYDLSREMRSKNYNP